MVGAPLAAYTRETVRRREQIRQARRDLIKVCGSGLTASELRPRVLAALSQLISVDAAFFASADPATLLFTGATSVGIPTAETPRFLDNELNAEDVNQFVDLARGPRALDSLDHATSGERELSQRYRSILAPLGLGDELRVAFRAGGTAWGFMCLHRESAQAGFGSQEVADIRPLLPHITEALRSATLAGLAARPTGDEAAVVVVFNLDLSIASSSPFADLWLDELRAVDSPRHPGAPAAVASIVERVLRRSSDPGATDESPARARVPTRSGWLVLHGSRLSGEWGRDQVAVVIERAAPHHLAPLVLEAYRLTSREGEVTRLVLQGCTGPEIGALLHITTDTVQDHLKAVFAKAGVRNRRELILAMYGLGGPSA
jgi:DNA-binding CsgD family transcriptional regulator